MIKINLQFFGGSGASLRSGGGLAGDTYNGVAFSGLDTSDRQVLTSANRLSGTTYDSREAAVEAVKSAYGIRNNRDANDVVNAATTGEFTFRSDGSGGKFATNGAHVVGQYYKNFGGESGYVAFVRMGIGSAAGRQVFKTATEAKAHVEKLLKQTNVRFKIGN